MIMYNTSKLFSFLLILLKFMDLVFSNDECSAQNFSVAFDSRKSFNIGKNVQYICVNGYHDTTIWAIWTDVEIVVKTNPRGLIDVITEKSCQEIHEKYNKSSRNLIAVWVEWLRKRDDKGKETLIASPYGTSCFAISVSRPGSLESLEAEIHKLRLLYPVTMVLGIVLFYEADEITRSIFFYYTAGISVGMILAIFLLLFIISKFMPQRGIGYAFMFCGSSLVLYLYQKFKTLIVDGNFAEMKIFYAYFIFAGIISFLYCYYRGPIESARGLDIMRWSVQAVALCMVYNSVQSEKISLTFVLILIATKWITLPGITHYILTRGWIPYRLQAYFRGPRFINMEEYEKEGIEETAKALKELREFCQSPQCNTWRTVSRLKSPKRFASFMSDGVDITPEERRDYAETSFDYANFLTSDEDDSATGEL